MGQTYKKSEISQDVLGLRVAQGESVFVVSDAEGHLESLLKELEVRADKSRSVTGKTVKTKVCDMSEDATIWGFFEDEQWIIGFRNMDSVEDMRNWLQAFTEVTGVFVFRDGECFSIIERSMLLPEEGEKKEKREDFLLTEEETRQFVATSVKTDGTAILIADKVAHTHDLVGEILSQEFFSGDALFGDKHVVHALTKEYGLKTDAYENKKSMRDTKYAVMGTREMKPVHILNVKAEHLEALLDMNNVLAGGSVITISKREFSRVQERSIREITDASTTGASVHPWVLGLTSSLLVGVGSTGNITSLTTITEEMEKANG
ncbi:hypothetical protein B4086_5630 [Bacillus cereus]|nr:hypothetical protein B4086_5630 [Bacillus cereus]